MRSRIVRLDEGLAVMIPSSVAQESALQEGSHVDVHYEGARLTIKSHIDHPVDASETTGDSIQRDTYWGDPTERQVFYE